MSDELNDGAGDTPSQDIAIVGMAGRFPGAADLDEYWNGLLAGRVAVARLSREELLAAGVPAAELDDPAYVPARGMLAGTELFDAGFFGIPPREADLMDPQHRLLLETAWEALESGGLITDRPPGRVGVFAGSGFNYYLQQQVLADPELLAEQGLLSVVLANEKDHLAARIAYRLGLNGPAIGVQTACSTSLVAVHLACQSLRTGDSDLALAGGVDLEFPQRAGYRYEPKGIMSPDGACRPFDAAANGTVPGSGVGMVVLKRAEDARRDGDRVLALISGSAVNNDGAAKVGYTAPGVAGQVDVLARAYAAARVDPSTIGYLEAHGTATEVGDAIELSALREVFGDGRGACSLGSVKANIGHLSAAAGVAGLIKAALALHHRRIPPLAGLDRPRAELTDPGSPFTVDTVAREWTVPDGRPRRAAVSSFGLGGTNVHVVLTEAPADPAPPTPTAPDVVLVSAPTEPALRSAAERLARHLADHPGLPLPDVALTTQQHRRHFAHRIAVAAPDTAEAARALVGAPVRTALRRPEVVFLLPGQGAEAPGMAEWAYRRYPSFAADIDRGSELARHLLGVDLRDLLVDRDPQGLIHRTDLTQPALVLHEYALGRLLGTFGVRPAALLGHSVGEYAAAGLAGELGLADTLRLVAERGALMRRAPEGGMLVVLAAPAVVRAELAGPDELDIAAVNAPEVVVVSGPVDALTRLRARLDTAGIQHRVLPTERAFHSRMMAGAAAALDAVAAAVEAKPGEVDVISTVSGRVLPAGGLRPPGYWAEQLRSPVRYQDAVVTAAARGRTVLVEVGPGSGLIGSARQIPEARQAPVVALQPRRGDLLRGLGALWASGVELDWAAVRAGAPAVRAPLPARPFAAERHWLDTPAARDAPVPVADRVPVAAPVPVADPAADDEDRTVQQIAEIWRSLLGVPTVGADSDFFTLGGESLLFIRMIAQVQRRFGVPVRIAELADAPTPRAIAAHVIGG
ncbi:acyltransferase domain-containing protein [Kitasatospora purpeofusca]|uniref:type I polyketide synthase n=1 Tax=Kitasatospora purpeofusca TaxID=67352 RepID=UPI002E0ED5B9|nr:acyltransferase domain-containing protein [Kitasatospora purpeofusca]